jgi:hypothetical protein
MRSRLTFETFRTREEAEAREALTLRPNTYSETYSLGITEVQLIDPTSGEPFTGFQLTLETFYG